MTDNHLDALLSGYAAGTLTADEREQLFAMAMERQDIFDRMLLEEPLREALSDGAVQQRLAAVLAPPAKRSWFRSTFLTPNGAPAWALTITLLAVVAGGVLIYTLVNRIGQNTQEIALRDTPVPQLSKQPELESASPDASSSTAVSSKREIPIPKVPANQPPKLALRSQPVPPRAGTSVEPAPAVPQPQAATGGVVAGVLPPEKKPAAAEPLISQSTPQSAPMSNAQSAPLSTAAPPPPPISNDSPQTIFLSSSAKARTSSRFGVAGSAIRAPLLSKALTPLPLTDLPPRSAMRISFQAADGVTYLDWRSGVAVASFVQVEATSPGYMTLIEEDSNAKRSVLASNTRLSERNLRLRIPLARSPGSIRLTVIYSASPLPSEFMGDSAGTSDEEIHTADEQALYAASALPQPKLALMLHFEVH